MTPASDFKDSTSERSKNTVAFKVAYGRLNYKQQQKEQKVFCFKHDITAGGFRARLAGTVRVSDSELAQLEAQVEEYFPKKATA